ncbi:beta-N-acetylglucosaminidase domain-containing protein [Streptomyces odontomachi]|uniref:beta-N-acetylglucosaminidase domain-containing protein n=1 Tax=Streptomyces odontomachi TaxID=2944940 RepID=UPI00210A30B6|nr:beta-N-acetylglucosaminidase domain-containing protein [Streptomyces sp. ODS25]
MRLGRRKRAAAVAVAVIAGAFGTTGSQATTRPTGAPAASPDGWAGDPGQDDASGAAHAPERPAAPAGTASGDPAPRSGSPALPARTHAASDTPAVWPRPQWMRARGHAIRVSDDVVLVTDRDRRTDPYALDDLRTLLRAAGARRITEVSDDARLPGGTDLVVRVGADTSNSGFPTSAHGPASPLADALRGLHAPGRGDLPSGGYRLAVGRLAGRDTVALAGVGPDGLFHGVQTLRQLFDGRRIAAAVVRDWPATPVRGLTEGFYGTPWTLEQRLDQVDFLGRSKQNRYLYAPGDDPYRQARWREPYPAEQRADFRTLAERARRNHVTLAWAVAPGQAMCLASDDDVRALNRKIDAMWALGVRAVQLQFQDVSYSEWHCAEDADAFGSGPEAAARAQARVANAVARHLAERHPGAAPLSVLPTEYYQDGATPYRRALARQLDAAVEVAWTGVGVVPRTITGQELAGARAAFGHPLVTMDNYPVNDFAQDRIFLGPYTGRAAAVADGSAALLATAMQQPAASRIPLFTAADFAWNPDDYRPDASWQAAIDAAADETTAAARQDAAGTGGSDPAARRAAVRGLAENDASSVLGATESASLRPLVDAFWAQRTTPPPATHTRAGTDLAATRLRTAFGDLRVAPDRLRGTALGDELRPWLDQLAAYGAAGQAAVDMLAAQADGDGAAAWAHAQRLERLRTGITARKVTVGKGVLDPFLDRAQQAYDSWTGLDRLHREQGEKQLTVDGTTVHVAHPRALGTVTVLAAAGSTGQVEVHVPGGGWHRLGALAASGWTERDTKQAAPRLPRHARVDAVRVAGAPAGAVRQVIPWFTDGPASRFGLVRAEADAAIGGDPVQLSARLTSLRPGTVHGKLVMQRPEGFTVHLPAETVLPRGAEVTVPVTVSVAPGTRAGAYQIPFTFGDRTRIVTVRAFPRTAGPDLAHGARADSSGDETPDFPASAAVDGDPDTRWSSPVRDDAWWQVRLARPARLGAVVLRWQDAYARAYRVQVSTDGRTWRTAATVRDGAGGAETVRMDAPHVRYLRIQGIHRATRYGYSLWSVQAYAVAD